MALIFQPYRPETQVVATATQRTLQARGVDAVLLDAFDLGRHAADAFQMVLTFGGDGTALRAAAWLAAVDVPIVPVRMGKLSFLAEIGPEELSDAIELLVSGEFWIDERSMLEARSGSLRLLALNEVVVGRGAASRAVRLDVYVDGELLARFTSDGIVVSTATGSTAYAFAAGGPILTPSIRDILLVPIAPHLTHLRAVVFPADSRVRVVAHSIQPSVLSADGHLDDPLPDEGEVELCVAPETTRFARIGSRSAFYRSLEVRLVRQS